MADIDRYDMEQKMQDILEKGNSTEDYALLLDLHGPELLDIFSRVLHEITMRHPEPVLFFRDMIETYTNTYFQENWQEVMRTGRPPSLNHEALDEREIRQEQYYMHHEGKEISEREEITTDDIPWLDGG